MTKTRTSRPTIVGVALMLLFPPFVLALDGLLELSGRETISRFEWLHPRWKRATIAWLALWTVGLTLHFLGYLWGP